MRIYDVSNFNVMSSVLIESWSLTYIIRYYSYNLVNRPNFYICSKFCTKCEFFKFTNIIKVDVNNEYCLLKNQQSINFSFKL